MRRLDLSLLLASVPILLGACASPPPSWNLRSDQWEPGYTQSVALELSEQAAYSYAFSEAVGKGWTFQWGSPAEGRMIFELRAGVMVNEILLQRGLAKVVPSPPNVKYLDHFMAIQQEAQTNRVGIWGQ